MKIHRTTIGHLSLLFPSKPWSRPAWPPTASPLIQWGWWRSTTTPASLHRITSLYHDPVSHKIWRCNDIVSLFFEMSWLFSECFLKLWLQFSINFTVATCTGSSKAWHYRYCGAFLNFFKDVRSWFAPKTKLLKILPISVFLQAAVNGPVCSESLYSNNCVLTPLCQ